MAKLSEAQQKQLDKLLELQKEEEYEPPSEVAFEIGGAKVYIPYQDAKRFLKKNGVDLDEVLEEGGEVEGEEEGEEGEGEEGEEGEGEEGENSEGEVARIPRKKSPVKSAPVVESTRSQRYFRKSS